ncbi:hypothetical protein PybrP1_012803 [[Pythium] brassicae (nom. inval.)]|nr:hypothetical protein PybrP1_012803 [[Pythium] brassicae (nom. inval.)]
MKDSASSRNRAATSSSNAGGIQLLSPTSLEVARSTVAPRPAAAAPAGAKGGGGSRVTTAKGSDFDFNSFTLECVRATTVATSSSSAGSSANSSNASGGNPPRKVSVASSDSASCLSSQAEKFADALDAQPSLDGASSFHTMRSTEDFDALELRRRHPSTVSAAVVVSASAPVAPVLARAAVRKKTAVVAMGWLQKRKGLVLKRWKAYFCLLRDDDQLCLYASEDTVNGRVEQRVQVLRVLLTDKSDAFHVIGVGADGTPRKDEFRAAHSVDWSSWFRAFRGFLDAVSLQGVLQRKPELAELSPASSRGSEDSYDDSHCNSRVGPYAATAHGSKSVRPRMPHHEPSQRRSVATRVDSARGSLDRPLGEESLPHSTLSAISAFAGVSSWSSPSNQDDAKTDDGSDCPLIDSRDLQPVPILEREHDTGI